MLTLKSLCIITFFCFEDPLQTTHIIYLNATVCLLHREPPLIYCMLDLPEVVLLLERYKAFNSIYIVES